jgi:hypothetical protein
MPMITGTTALQLKALSISLSLEGLELNQNAVHYLAANTELGVVVGFDPESHLLVVRAANKDDARDDRWLLGGALCEGNLLFVETLAEHYHLTPFNFRRNRGEIAEIERAILADLQPIQDRKTKGPTPYGQKRQRQATTSPASQDHQSNPTATATVDPPAAAAPTTAAEPAALNNPEPANLPTA